MLQVISLASPQLKKSFLDEFLTKSDHSTWIVSDLRNKFEVQQFILEKQDSFEDLSVLRASELWRFLLKRVAPEMELVSRDFVRVWIRERLKKEEVPFAAQADQTILEMMDLMNSVFLHPEGGAQLRDWFQDNPESLQRWGGWFLLAEKFFQELMGQNKISSHWAVGYLLYGVEKKWDLFWKRPLIVDLGAQLGKNEAEILLQLSQICDICVLSPAEEYLQQNRYLLQPYEMLAGFAKGQRRELNNSEATSKEPTHQESVRFSGPLAECKYVCQKVREWLDQGVAAHQIAVIAPDIELYWPWLQPLLKTEGFPVNKDLTARLQNLPSVSRWLARLRLFSGNVCYPDLERALFTDSDFPIRFEEFHSLFAELIGDQDLSRHEKIKKSFELARPPSGPMSIEQFTGFSLKHWPRGGEWQPLETAMRELLTHGDFLGELTLSSWVYFLEQVLAKKEMRLEKARTDGIEVTNLSSADSLKITHRIFIGLTEKSLKGRPKTLLSPKEVLDIAQKFGFYLEHPEVSITEFDLHWQSKVPGLRSIFSFPQTGFSGSAEAPTQFWLGLPSTSPLVEGSRWDQLLKADLGKALTSEYQWSEERSRLAEQQIHREVADEPTPNIQIKEPISLSPSSIERYRKCPFIFTAEKVFGLVDPPIVDLDVDRRTRGTLAHALLEKICIEPVRFDWSEGELRGLIESLREQIGLTSMDNFVWKALVEKHVRMALRFLQFEKEWRKSFPETKILATEKGFETMWSEGASEPWKIRGKIDRIDEDHSGRKVVIDYKITAGSYQHSTSWIEKNELQLGFYMLALEEGWIADIPASEVVGAFYFILKNMNRDKGLKVIEAAGTLFTMDGKKNDLTLEAKTALLLEVKKVIGEAIRDIQSGRIDPEPLKPEDCPQCSWRKLCRAPHLI